MVQQNSTPVSQTTSWWPQNTMLWPHSKPLPRQSTKLHSGRKQPKTTLTPLTKYCTFSKLEKHRAMVRPSKEVFRLLKAQHTAYVSRSSHQSNMDSLSDEHINLIGNKSPTMDPSPSEKCAPESNPNEEIRKEVAATQLLSLINARVSKATPAADESNSDDGSLTRDYSTYGTDSGGFTRIRRKSWQIEKQYDCCFCEKKYGSLSAVSLHLRHKHPFLVKTMMGVGEREELVPLHARSVAAYSNEALGPKHLTPARTAHEAISLSAPDKCTSMSHRALRGETRQNIGSNGGTKSPQAAQKEVSSKGGSNLSNFGGDSKDAPFIAPMAAADTP